MTVPAVPGMGPGLGYYVQGHYTVDGVYDIKRAVFYDAFYADNMETPLSFTTEYRLRH